MTQMSDSRGKGECRVENVGVPEGDGRPKNTSVLPRRSVAVRINDLRA
jgi:hypothetical protein